jgi:hypothetical protein
MVCSFKQLGEGTMTATPPSSVGKIMRWFMFAPD